MCVKIEMDKKCEFLQNEIIAKYQCEDDILFFYQIIIQDKNSEIY